MGEINLSSFTGMNNINSAFYAKKGIVSPRLVLNADVDAAGRVNKRDGFTEFIELPNAHSLWACEDCMLCCGSGKLYDITTGELVEIAADSNITAAFPLSYVLVEGRVYISNEYWNGVYDLTTRTILNWGVALPTQPILLRTDGNLPVGTYHITLTNFDSVTGEMSGNGQIASITLDSEGGIEVLNRPVNSLVWATDSDSYTFQLVGDIGVVVDIPTIEPLPSFMCSPPLPLTCLTYAFGRVWGARGDTLYYSEPYRIGWFKLSSNFFKFNSNITLIASVPTGLFIGMETQTVFLAGSEPEQMAQTSAGAGSIRGTLAYCNNLPELGDILGTAEKTFVDVPVWRTVDGIVAGNVSGRLFNLTKHKIRIGKIDKGASLYRQKCGSFQFLTSSLKSSYCSDVGCADSVECEVWRNGKLIDN